MKVIIVCEYEFLENNRQVYYWRIWSNLDHWMFPRTSRSAINWTLNLFICWNVSIMDHAYMFSYLSYIKSRDIIELFWKEKKNMEKHLCIKHNFKIRLGPVGSSGTRPTRNWNRVRLKKKLGVTRRVDLATRSKP